MTAKRDVKWRRASELAATRRTIQHEYLRMLNEADFSFRTGDKEPYGLQRKVMRSVNQQFYGPTRMKTNPQQVSDWVRRVRENNYEVTSCEQDYSESSQNSRVFFDAEQQRIRDFIRDEKMKCTEIESVWSDEDQKMITVSASSARRFMKKQLGDEPSHVAAKPKARKVGGMTAHHNKARLTEAKYWNNKAQEEIDGIVFADESKMRFREHPNKQIDIEWCFRGDASEVNWHEAPRHCTQINLFLVITKNGILMYDLYDKNMSKADYEEKLPTLREKLDEAEDFEMTYYMHDNAWRGARPTRALNEFIGEGRWTQYMGTPCKKNHPTMRTPKSNRPCKVPKLRCPCVFPDGPIHAAYNPKLNLTENVFAELDRQLLKNKRADIEKGKTWLVQRTKRKVFWKRQVRKAIRQVNKNKEYFANQYASFKTRCQAFIASRGKRLKTSKW